jgi:hypothetical protein
MNRFNAAALTPGALLACALPLALADEAAEGGSSETDR